jgi:hypothetical protein
LLGIGIAVLIGAIEPHEHEPEKPVGVEMQGNP